MNTLTKRSITFFSLVIPFLILLTVVGFAGNLILNLQDLERQANQAMSDWNALYATTMQLFALTPRHAAQDIQAMRNTWRRDLQKFETSLYTLYESAPKTILPDATVEKIENAWTTWEKLSRPKLEEGESLLQELLTSDIGQGLTSITYTDLVESAMTGMHTQNFSTESLWQFYRLQDSLTDLDVSGQVFTTVLNQITSKIHEETDRLVTIIIGITLTIAIFIIGITFFFSQRSENQLRKSEQQFRRLFEQSNDAIFIFKTDGYIVDVNTHACEMLGYTREELLTKFIPSLHPEQEVAAAKAAIETCREEGATHFESQFQRADGTILEVDISASLIASEQGLVQGIARDITERKRAAAERERLQQQVLDTQQHVIRELSTPIIPLMEGIIVIPLIGNLDTQRARDLTRALLAGIREHEARVVILDITGVPIVDSGVAAHLDQTIRAAQLKGARTIITGISNAVAEAIVDLGIDWSRIETLRDLQTGLHVAVATGNTSVKLTR